MKTFTELYGDSQFRSSRGIREPALQYTEPDELSQVLNFALDELKIALDNARNPERYAEKFSRSVPGLVDNIERITKSLEKMR
tara:strand:+ start:333 stop:581 length:249 start_codon:yes stop_codon:yes gene_type:complete